MVGGRCLVSRVKADKFPTKPKNQCYFKELSFVNASILIKPTSTICTTTKTNQFTKGKHYSHAVSKGKIVCRLHDPCTHSEIPSVLAINLGKAGLLL